MLHAVDEEVVQRAVAEAALAHLLLERRKQRVELLRLVQPGELASGEEGVDALEEGGGAQLVVFEEEDRRLAAHAHLWQHRLELSAEGLDAVLARRRRGDQLEAVHVAHD